jgi:hypothetical protein
MTYYKVLIEVWCDWDPEDSALEEMVRHVLLGEDAICTLQMSLRSPIVRKTSTTRKR